MEKVYITKSKLESIAFELDHGRFTKDDLRHFFEGRFLTTFSHKELKTLSAVKYVLESMQDEDMAFTLIGEIKTNRSNYHNNRGADNLVFNKASTPAFHMNELCPMLINDYTNFVIPAVIPKVRYDEFRAFFKQNFALYKRNQEVFFANAELAFGVVIQNVKEIHAANTGTETLNVSQRDSEAHEIIQEMDGLATAMDAYRNQSKHVQKIIDDTGFNPKAALAKPQYRNDTAILEQWKAYKAQMRDLIVEQIYSIFAPERRLSRHSLTELGFKACAGCLGGNHDHDANTCVAF